MRFLRIMNENDDRTEERSREEKEPEEEEVVRAEAIGGGVGTTAEVDEPLSRNGVERPPTLCKACRAPMR